MKIKDAINMANLMEQGNVLPKELAILFLSELDGMIQSDIMLHAPEEIVSYDNEEQELLLRPPHDKLYVHYLVMMIRNQQQEYEGYQNTQAAVDEKLKTFRRWYVQHYRPADTDSRSYMGGTSADGFGFAYLTAYGLAVRNGYQGTEEQWLESLHGAPGDPGAPARMRYDEAREMIQWGVGDTWYDLFSLQALRDPAVAEFLAEVEASAQSALRSAEAANRAAGTAQSASSQSQKAADDANEAAGAATDAAVAAAQSANMAQAGETGAKKAQAGAEAAAGSAENRAVAAGNYAKAAEESAKRAETAAGNAGGGGTGDINDAIEGHNTDLAAHAPMQNNLNALRDRAISEAIGSHNTDLTAHPYFHERCNDLEEALKGKLGTGELGAVIDTALAEAKKNGAFDGADGADGRGIKSIARTAGNGAAGTVDTYTITYTDGTTSTFNVRNGDNGKNGTDGKDGIDGADGQPGSDGITPHIGSNGNWYIGTTDTGIKAQGPKGDDGADGKTPIKGSDYWTPADQESIVQQVIAALGTPVFGRVDGENNIILTGELADGTYTLKYEDAEGNVTEIGTLNHVIVPAPTYINQIPLSINADGSPYVGDNGEDGYRANYRINSSNQEVEADGMGCTGYIPCTWADTLRFANIGMNGTSANVSRIKLPLYDADFNYLGDWMLNGLYTNREDTALKAYGVSFDSNGNLTMLAITAMRYWGHTPESRPVAYIRVTCDDITDASVITINQEIV